METQVETPKGFPFRAVVSLVSFVSFVLICP
jgi:hypothetical protein